MLHKIYQNIATHYPEIGIFVPDYMHTNLKHPLRNYQQQAIKNFIYWDNKDVEYRLSTNHVLLQMATGTGKTLLMAALMLYLHNKGYRKFLFFVNSSTIIEKTKHNFIHSANAKYLFADHIQLQGKNLCVRAIDHFDEADEHNINIWFTTIQGLHTHLNNERENATTFDDFANHKVVFLGDEAHHNSSQTQQRNISLFGSWEDTILTSFNKNAENYLIELTATANLDKAEMRQKYEKKILFDYGLRAFREDGYSKNIRVVDTQIELKQRILLSLIISEYKRHIAADHRFKIKPVILFRSKTIKESKQHAQLLQNILDELNDQNLSDLANSLSQESKNPFLKDIQSFINHHHYFLLKNIPIAFHHERVINVNNEKTQEQNQRLLNSLEEAHNQIRVIFAVNKLNEGWDVLNLYDIVKLYEVKNIKDTAVSEVQLIGRGARYYPFAMNTDNPEDDLFKRKYDHPTNDTQRQWQVLEQLHYHSLQNVAFIRELNQQLEIVGLSEPSQKEVSIKLKKSFKQTALYQQGFVFSNERKLLDKKFNSLLKHTQIDLFSPPGEYPIPQENILIDLTANISEHAIDEEQKHASKRYKNVSIEEIATPLFYKALSQDAFFNFDHISQFIKGNLSSVNDLQTLFGNSTITFHYHDKALITAHVILTALVKLLAQIKQKMDVSQKHYQGSKTFHSRAIKQTFYDLKKSVPINRTDSCIMEDTSDMTYFAQDSFYGDSSYEKTIIQELQQYFSEDNNQQKYSEVHILRNYGEIKLYHFADGKGFEPDFIVFLKKQGQPISYQLFVEPKGEHLSEYEQWKEHFLQELCQIAHPNTIEIIGVHAKNFRIIGLPFYNDQQKQHFFNALNNKLHPSP